MTAKMLLVKKIGNNTPECISEGKDVYKRTLAECFVNGESLSSFWFEVVMHLPIENIQRNLLKMKTLQKLTN